MEGSKVAAYFDLDGTLLDASSEKTLTGHLTKKRPWRIPVGLLSWSSRFAIGLLTGKAVYDAARNRGHFTGVKWSVLEEMSEELVREKLLGCVPKEAHECLDWHRSQGHRLVLVTATVAPMAEVMGKALKMDTIYGCGPQIREGRLSGSERMVSTKA